MNQFPVIHTNRYGNVFTFNPSDDGHILWTGDFEFHRIGRPNDYSKAYDEYCKRHIENFYDGPRLTLDEFKKIIHEWDDELRKFVWDVPDIRALVTPDMTKIDMVDPSGGPYVATGMKMDGGVVIGFEAIETGYKILIDRSNG